MSKKSVWLSMKKLYLSIIEVAPGLVFLLLGARAFIEGEVIRQFLLIVSIPVIVVFGVHLVYRFVLLAYGFVWLKKFENNVYKEAEEAGALLKNIMQSFSGVTLGDGISFNMAKYLECLGDDQKRQKALDYQKQSEKDERELWFTLKDELIESNPSILCYTDLKGFKFYLPAYMTYSLVNGQCPEAKNQNIAIYALNPERLIFNNEPVAEQFTEEQWDCILGFLVFCSSVEYLDNKAARKNLKALKEVLKEKPNYKNLKKTKENQVLISGVYSTL